jgi:hypothetical protein
MKRSQRPAPDEGTPSEVLSLPAVLLLERHQEEADFLWSLVHDVMRADLWLWHESEFAHAEHLLSYCRFRLILLDSGFAKRLSVGALVRRIQGLARGTPVILRLPPEDLPPNPETRVYGVAAVVPRGLASPTERAMRQALHLR